ncbi:MAG: YraN family protein [Pseudomonadota bacterium]|jgi:putative endonuclease
MGGSPALTGPQAESWAAEYLTARGLRLIERNYRCRLGEIDLVMAEGAAVVFVEVRYRSGNRYGGALESVDRHKCRRLLAAAQHYMIERRVKGAVRLDVVAVSPGTAGPEAEWIRNAIEAQ